MNPKKLHNQIQNLRNHLHTIDTEVNEIIDQIPNKKQALDKYFDNDMRLVFDVMQLIEDALQEEMRKPHWIATNGLPGYMPDSCNVYEEPEAAVSLLTQLYDLKPSQVKELKADGILYVENYVLEVTECDCDKPHIHQEDMPEDEFYKEWNNA